MAKMLLALFSLIVIVLGYLAIVPSWVNWVATR